jgi:hypothetical protein
MLKSYTGMLVSGLMLALSMLRGGAVSMRR